MRKINLNSAYKINESKHKKYVEHYQIPAPECLVVPVRLLGEDISCDVRWQDEDGTKHEKQQLVFKSDNLTPLNPLLDDRLHELFSQYNNQN